MTKKKFRKKSSCEKKTKRSKSKAMARSVKRQSKTERKQHSTLFGQLLAMFMFVRTRHGEENLFRDREINVTTEQNKQKEEKSAAESY